MDFDTYYDYIVESNQAFFRSYSLTHCAESFGFGLIEEYGEYFDAETSEQAMLEAGDILAYTCLLAQALELPLHDAWNNWHDLLEPNGSKVASFMKRYTRGDEQMQEDKEDFAFLIASYLRWILNYRSLSLSVVAEANKVKLDARIANTGTYKGKGNR